MPPVYTPRSTLTAEPVSLAYAEFKVIGGGCELQVIAEWALEDSRISREEVFYEIRSLRKCADRVGRDLPNGWWTDLQAPDPFAAIVTAQLETSGGSLIENRKRNVASSLRGAMGAGPARGGRPRLASDHDRLPSGPSVLAHGTVLRRV